jgi:hypothetical protein
MEKLQDMRGIFTITSAEFSKISKPIKQYGVKIHPGLNQISYCEAVEILKSMDAAIDKKQKNAFVVARNRIVLMFGREMEAQFGLKR